MVSGRLAINALFVKGWFGKQTLGKMKVGESTILQTDRVGETTLGESS